MSRATPLFPPLSVSCSLALVALLALPAHADGDAALRAAYQREYAFLEAEKHALQKRLEEARRDADARKAQAREEIATLERRLVSLTLDADRQDARLADQERASEGESDASEALASLLSQARTLAGESSSGGPSGAPDEEDGDDADPAAIAAAFSRTTKLLEERASVRKAPGSFFDARGQKVEGTLVKLGEVAAFGIADTAAGPLAPAGAGQLKLWQGGRAEDARALAYGDAPASLQLFLFESLEKGIEPPKEKTPLQIVQAGGSIAWVIVGLGLFALLLVVLRLLALLAAGRGAGRLLADVSDHVRLGNHDEALSLVEKSPGAMARVLRAALLARDLPREQRADRIDEQILRAFALIDRFGALILVMAAVAPLLGLLGTVTGMIATFDAITEFGTGDPRVLAGGISEALITTELGLIVAIPALILGNLLSGMGERMKRDLETAALTVANLCDEGEDAEVIDVQLKKAS